MLQIARCYVKHITEQKEINETMNNIAFDNDEKQAIEITEQEKNIIRYCVEDVYNAAIENNNSIRAKTVKEILDKLVAIKEKETKQNTFSKSYFF